MKIAIVGIGYVGLSTAILLAQNNEVVLLDISEIKVRLINEKKSPIQDTLIEEYLCNKKLTIKATLDKDKAYKNADYIIVAVSTDYNPDSKSLDVSQIDLIIKDITMHYKNSWIVIKSTVPIGYTKTIKAMSGNEKILYCPEFSKEGNALYDNLFPSRIIISNKNDFSQKFINALIEGAVKKHIEVIYTTSTEAEAIKVFSNAFLAMRISFFNEVDTYAEINNLDASNIIKGMGYDNRIGLFYNNPSFGFGGYCLPKDTSQLLKNFENIPQAIISAIIESNNLRKKHISKMIIERNPNSIGIYRINTKKDSDNYRNSSTIDIINYLNNGNYNLFIYEPLISTNTFNGIKVVNDYVEFIKLSDIIVANRISKELSMVKHKVYSRDLFGLN